MNITVVFRWHIRRPRVVPSSAWCQRIVEKHPRREPFLTPWPSLLPFHVILNGDSSAGDALPIGLMTTRIRAIVRDKLFGMNGIKNNSIRLFQVLMAVSEMAFYLIDFWGGSRVMKKSGVSWWACSNFLIDLCKSWKTLRIMQISLKKSFILLDIFTMSGTTSTSLSSSCITRSSDYKFPQGEIFHSIFIPSFYSASGAYFHFSGAKIKIMETKKNILLIPARTCSFSRRQRVTL